MPVLFCSGLEKIPPVARVSRFSKTFQKRKTVLLSFPQALLLCFLRIKALNGMTCGFKRELG